jgi:hypothetical protein
MRGGGPASAPLHPGVRGFADAGAAQPTSARKSGGEGSVDKCP